jgi:hypothetical protein
MKLQDLFLPRYQHSNPEVRIKAVSKLKDANLLKQISEKDQAESVRRAALARISELGQYA